MTSFIISVVAIAIVGFILLRKGRDQRVRNHPTARWLMIAGLIPLGLQVAVLLLFGLGEMMSGDLSGAGHLLPVVTTLVLALLAWRRPVEGGVALVLVGILSGVTVRGAPAFWILVFPAVVSGVLFLIAAQVARSEAIPEGQQGS
jgi:hypothetical protein